MHIVEMGVDPEKTFCCPMTGKQLFGPNGFQSSKAMAFVYSPDASDFAVIQPWAKKIWDATESKASEDDMHSDLFEQFLKKLKKHSNLVMFVFSADGPWTFTNYLCFDFAYGTEGVAQDTATPESRAGKKPKAGKKPAKKAKKKRTTDLKDPNPRRRS